MRADSEIIRKILIDGNINAYRHLVDKYKGLVFTLCYRIIKNREEAEELTQDVFVKGHQELSKLKEAQKFKHWIMRIAYTKSIDKVRLNRLETISISAIGEDHLLENNTPYTILKRTDRINLIKKSLKKLPGDESAIITLYYLEDQSIQKVSEALNITPSNVKIKLFRARKKLYDLLPAELKSNQEIPKI